MLRPYRCAGQQDGGTDTRRPVQLNAAQWNAQLELNLTSVFISCKHAIPFMRRRAQGAIVNVASTSGIRWAGAAQVVYAAAKASAIQFGRVAVLNDTTTSTAPMCLLR